MAVDFSGSGSDVVSFGSVPSLGGLNQISVLVWADFDAYATAQRVLEAANAGTDAGFEISFDASQRLNFIGFATGTDGGWYSSTLSTGRRHLVFTFDGTTPGNDPLIYHDGVSQSVTTNANFTGTFLTASEMRVGNYKTSSLSMNGRILSILVYNRIFSASEISDAYNSRLAVPSWRGLVFAPQLWTVKDGDAVGTIRDLISGAAGTPAGSPIGRGDDVLRIEGIN